MDIIPKEYDFWQNLYCLLLYSAIAWLGYYNTAVPPRQWRNVPSVRRNWLFGLFFIFVLTNFSDHDYFAYFQTVKEVDLDSPSHLENVYLWIIKVTGRNYLLFRTAVWGSAIWVFCRGAKQAGVSVFHCAYILAACFMGTFSYGRVSLAMTLVYTGYIIFYTQRNKNLSRTLLGIAIFISAFFFHRSIVIAMAMVVIMPFVPINKKTIWLLIFFIPVVGILVKSGFLYILETGGGLNEETANYALRYSITKRQQANFMGYVHNIFSYAPYYIYIYILFRRIYITPLLPKVSVLQTNMFKIALGLIFMGTSFFFFGLDNSVFAYRIMYMSMIPLSYTIVSMYQNRLLTLHELKTIIGLGIASNLYSFLYHTYSQF